MKGPQCQTNELGHDPAGNGGTEGITGRASCQGCSLAAGWRWLAEGRACPVGHFWEERPEPGLPMTRTQVRSVGLRRQKRLGGKTGRTWWLIRHMRPSEEREECKRVWEEACHGF